MSAAPDDPRATSPDGPRTPWGPDPGGSPWHERVPELTAADPRLLAHCVAVATTCASLARCCGLDDHEVAVAQLAGLLHDVGKAPSLRRDGELHHLTGARLLRDAGDERLARLVAHHSGGRFEAELAGQDLGAYEREQSLVADVLDLADLTTQPNGRPISIRGRYADIRERYGVRDGDAIALDLFVPDLTGVVARVTARIEGDTLRRRLSASWEPPAGRTRRAADGP
ncbi:HD domain-containing protein [Patulibacter sp. NPDC049589]|uniref:HD domain-containing protein n=1 Tax=Patulibacter sp. NPDC049589 TaxID=3154731 RepID=UPI0034247957